MKLQLKRREGKHMTKTFLLVLTVLIIASMTIIVAADNNTSSQDIGQANPGVAPSDATTPGNSQGGGQPGQCLAVGTQCKIITTANQQVDLCCDGSFCNNGTCVTKQNPNFFQQIWSAVTGQPSSTPPGIATGCDATTNICFSSDGQILCDAPFKECVAKYGQCTCGNPTTTPTNNNPGGTQGQPGQPTTTPFTNQQPDVCNPCNTVICAYPAGGQFVCPASLKECAAKFGTSCTILGCYQGLCEAKTNQCKDPTGAPITCDDTLANCNAQYQNSCTCGSPITNSSCAATEHLCYVTTPLDTPDANQGLTGDIIAALTTIRTIKCEGRYEDCVAKYGNCTCGIPPPKRCDATTNLCYPLQYATNGDVTTGTTTPSPTNAVAGIMLPAVQCNDTYANCVAEYGRCTCGTPPERTCTYNDQTYKMDETFPASDGCNKCYCGPNGQVRCSEELCTPCNEQVQTCYGPVGVTNAVIQGPIQCADTLANCNAKYNGNCRCGWNKTPITCTYNGQTYKNDETWSPNTCEKCYCRDGQAICNQEIPCPGQCTETTNRCYPATLAANVGYVDCQDTYTNCVAKYGQCDCGQPSSPVCTYNGLTYLAGASFPASDGCNKCSCTSDGKVVCSTGAVCPNACTAASQTCHVLSATTATAATYTTIECNDTLTNCIAKYGVCTCGWSAESPPPVAPLPCTYNSVTYQNDQSFPAGDGCNKCSCANGVVHCTELACPPPCTAVSNVCTSANGAEAYCNGTYTDCEARYKDAGGSCICGGSLTIKPYILNNGAGLT